MKMRTKLDATHLLYMLDLFEGRISYTDIMKNIPINILLEMQKLKEEQLEKEVARARKMKEEQLERANGKGGTITNTGKRYRT